MPSQNVVPGGNDGSMRPTTSFYPYSQQAVDMAINEDQVAWQNAHSKMDPCYYPGAADPYGSSNIVGARNCEQDHGCTGGRIFKGGMDGDVGKCSCPDGYEEQSANPSDPCVPIRRTAQAENNRM
jgi:hypothetical protein